MKKKNGFTLIELIAVLVILAILALIVTPLVMNIIRKARISADKRSIDAYGRSIEIAIAGYLLDTGKFPTDISQLTIEYSGDRVECSTTQLNDDSSVFLAGCTVAERSIDYTYGTDKSPTYQTYEIGDKVTYNNIDYYVINDSGIKESTVTLLKAEPITSAEISPYLSSTEIENKVNTNETYVLMAYYSAENCVSTGDISGCSTDYSVSDVKQLVDAWKTNYAFEAREARLITIDELLNNFDYEWGIYNISSEGYVPSENTPNWLYNIHHYYWTMSQYNDSSSDVWSVSIDGVPSIANVGAKSREVVRPVITIKKSAPPN